MATSASRILRIGVVVGGKIVQERLVRRGDPVTVGPSSKSTFVFEKTGVDSASFPVFSPAGAGYELHFTDQMSGKVSSGGAVVSLKQIRTDPSVRRGGRYALKLTEHDRGKVAMGDVTLLFQFVSPPPENGAVPLRSMDFRPRLLEEDDPVFLGFLAINSALATVLLVWIWNAPQPELTSLEDLPDRFTHLILEPDAPPEVADVEVEPEAVADDDAEPEPVADEAEPEPEPEPQSEVQQAQRDQRMREEISARYARIGTRFGRQGEDSFIRDLFGEMEDEQLNSALNVDGRRVAAADEGPRGSQDGTANADVDIGELGEVGGSETELSGGPGLQIDARPEAPIIEEGAPSDIASIKRIVDMNFGQMTACYETHLRPYPSLAGRVELEWYVEGGKVREVYVGMNQTGNDQFAECLVRRVGRWQFPPGLEIEVTYPFVFRQK